MKLVNSCLGYVGRAVRDCRRALAATLFNQKNDVYFMVGLLRQLACRPKTLF